VSGAVSTRSRSLRRARVGSIALQRPTEARFLMTRNPLAHKVAAPSAGAPLNGHLSIGMPDKPRSLGMSQYPPHGGLGL